VRFKALADGKKEIYDDDIIALIEDTQTSAAHGRMRLIDLHMVCGTRGPATATLVMDIDGKEYRHETTGNGPVDATFNAVKALVPHTARLKLYQVHAVTDGTDAQAEVSVRLEEDGKIVTGHAANADTQVASGRAYINALNKLMVRREKTAPAQLEAPLDAAE